MPDKPTATTGKVQAGNVSFELHSLGWEGFQNLCGHVLAQILGQTASVYSAVRDVGQDGAFQGTWKIKATEAFTGRFIVQCKFTSRRDAHLSLAQLSDELAKAAILAAGGHAQVYILITNAPVSGKAAIEIREAFLKISGIKSFELYGKEWLTERILESTKLRALVPRIYGLGDLTQILDQRVYRQAQEILLSWKENLSKFVPTQAHERSVSALLDKGFVLLLGEPMAGKSTIAAALALAAADAGCLPVFVSQPSEFRAHWNPDEPKQFFWVDDAFGSTQFNPSRGAEWNSIFPLMATAIKLGARVLFTSRDYIYKQALRELKVSAFPFLRDTSGNIVIKVEELSHQEKERILYNHIRLGSQPQEFKTAIKPLLSVVADNPRFFPEIAKRLGDPYFTKGLRITSESLKRFVEEPKEVLGEIITQIDHRHFSALALLFMRAGRVDSPPSLTPDEIDSIALLGTSLSDVAASFSSMEGCLTTKAFEGGTIYWKFRHPSIHDAMTINVAQRPELLDIYLRGAKISDVISEVVCGSVDIAGAAVRVPPSRYPQVISKLKELSLGWSDWNNRILLLDFLGKRCDSDFLIEWFKNCAEQYAVLAQNHGINKLRFSRILAKLYRTGQLPEGDRLAYVKKATTAAVKDGDSMFLNEDLQCLMTSEELAIALKRVKSELIPGLENLIISVEDEYSDPDDDPNDHFDDLRSNFEAFMDHFEEEDSIYDAFSNGIDLIDEAIERISDQNEEKESERRDEESDRAEHEFEIRRDTSTAPKGDTSESESRSSSRSMFDDVDH